MGPKPSGNVAKDNHQGKVIISVPVEGVEFVYEDPNVKPNKLTVYKQKDSNTIDIGRKTFGNSMTRVSDNHARLTFNDSKVSITDLGSAEGTWVQSKKGVLIKDSPHVLKDGDKIVLGAKNDKGIKDPNVVHVQVKFLNEIPPADKKRPISLHSDKSKTPPPSPKNEGKKSSSPAPKMSKTVSDHPNSPGAKLQPPAHGQHRRAVSLGKADKPKAMVSSDSTSIRAVQVTPHTILEQHISIPWSDTFRPGFGINALTGEFMARSALRPFKITESSKPGKSRISVECLRWEKVTDLQDEFEMSIGGTVNVPCPVGANAKIASVLSQHAAVSTILVQYKVEANFTADFIPETVQLKEGLDNLSGKEFRNQYGDYYIAGVQRAYSCRMVVVCQTDEKTISERHEKEVIALVENYFKGGIKFVDLEKQTTNFSLQSVIVDTEGCSADPSSAFSVAVIDAPKTLSQVLRDAPGAPRVAFLYHYSSLDSSNLSRRVHVRKNMFDRARAMRVVYAHIQACLLHPALQLFASDGRGARAVLKRFEDQRKSIVQTVKDDEKATKSIDALERDLASSKERADIMIRRYNFIRTVKGMDKGIVARPPTVVNGLYYYQWDCGKTGAAKKVTELKAYDLVCFELGYKAFELAWQSPMTDGSSTFRQLGALLGGASPRETMTFTTQSSDTVLPPSPFAPARKDHKLAKPRPAGQQPAGTQDPGTFSFCLTDHKPVCILGWSISCYWPDGGKSEPTIEVDHESHYIFSDRLSISVDSSRPTRWHCQVTFVIKSSYNFSDLLTRKPNHPVSNWQTLPPRYNASVK